MASVFFSYLSFILFFLYKFKFILWTTPTSKKTVHLYVDVKKSGYIYSKELAMWEMGKNFLFCVDVKNHICLIFHDTEGKERKKNVNQQPAHDNGVERQF